MRSVAVCVFCFCGAFPTAMLAAPPTLSIQNSGAIPFELFFMPAGSRQFKTPPLRVAAARTEQLTLMSEGKYLTVLRTREANGTPIDNTIGWIDFHHAYADDPSNVFKLRSFFVPEQRTQDYTYTVQIPQQRTVRDKFGRESVQTIWVPESRVRQHTYTVHKRALEFKFENSRGEVTGNYIFDAP